MCFMAYTADSWFSVHPNAAVNSPSYTRLSVFLFYKERIEALTVELVYFCLVYRTNEGKC